MISKPSDGKNSQAEDTFKIPPLAISAIVTILDSVITLTLNKILVQANPFLLLGIVLVVGTILWLGLELVTTKSKPQIGKWVGRGTVLAFLGVIVVSVIIVLSEYVPTLQALKEWDFEDGTTQNWGAFVNDRVSASTDVTVSPNVSQGNYSLEITTIDELTNEGNARKKLVAIHFPPEQLAEVRYIKADVYLPQDAAQAVGYADAKAFLKDSGFVWHDSGGGGEGIRIDHFSGQWRTIEWDLRLSRLFWGYPLKDYVGLQIYLKDSFKGPVYIDNILLFR